jgi:xanthine/uracil permease
MTDSGVLDVGFEERVRAPKLLLFGLQHLLTLSAIWVFPVLIGVSLGIADGDVARMVQASFLLAGLVTVLQSSRVLRLPIVQGPTAAFFAALLAAGSSYGLGAAFGSMVAAGLIFMVLTIPVRNRSALMFLLRYATDPLVFGTLCLIIGAQLATLGLPAWFGAEGEAGHGWRLFGVGLATLLVVVCCLLFGGRTLVKRAAILIGMLAGTLLALVAGLWHAPQLSEVAIVGPPAFLPFGFEVRWPVVLLMLLAFLESSAEAVGMYTLLSRFSAQPTPNEFPGPAKGSPPTSTPKGFPGLEEGSSPTSASKGSSSPETGSSPRPATHHGDTISGEEPGVVRDPRTDLSHGRISRGLFTEYAGSVVGALFGGIGTATYPENVGIVRVTRIGSRFVTMTAGAIAIVLAFLPAVSTFVASLPGAVLAAASTVLFGIIAMSGVQMMRDIEWDDLNLTVAATALILALGGQWLPPDIVATMPAGLKALVTTPMMFGAVLLILLNAVVNHGLRRILR